MSEKDLARRALDNAEAAHASYADIRVGHARVESIAIKNGRLEGLSDEYSEGFGVRVLVDGSWGFACSSTLSDAEVDRVVRQAVGIARASARVQHRPVDLGEPVRSRGAYAGLAQIDPFSVPLDEKVRLLTSAEEGLRSASGVAHAEASCEAARWHRLFASTEGAEVTQDVTECGAAMECLAVSDTDTQKRSYPNSFGREVAQGGWEVVQAMDLPGNAPRISDEAAALLRADPCPAGTTTVILDGDQVMLQVHESCGHPTELDRVYGTEAAYAGTSFMMPDMLGNLRYGSEKVTIVADATVPGGLGSFGYDDEGVPAQRVPLVERGLFVGYLTSRETASRLGLPSMGSMRAENWARLPLIRMTNINILPGEGTLEEMIAGTREGIYMKTNKSWSIDDRRLNFQFGMEIAWEIRDGRLGRMLRDPSYAGITPEFWNSMDAIAGPSEWRMYGITNCGKGQPGQSMRVGHGAAPARFRDARVGIS